MRTSSKISTIMASIAAACAILAPQDASAQQEGVQADRITWGMSTALTGYNAVKGIAIKEGIEAAFKKANDSGGVHGRKLVLKAEDDEYDPVKTEVKVKQLIADGVFGLTGILGTANNNKIAPLVIEKNIPVVGPITGAESTRNVKKAPQFFNTKASYADEMDAIVDHFQGFGITKIGAIYQDDAFGKGALEGLTKSLESRKLPPLVAAAPHKPRTSEVAAAVSELIKAGPEVIVIASVSAPGAAFVKAYRLAGGKAQIAAISTVGNDVLLEKAEKHSEGVILTQVTPNPDDRIIPLVNEFRLAMAVAFPAKKIADFSYFNFEGYIVGKALVMGTVDAGPSITRQSFMKSMEGISKKDIGGFVLSNSTSDHGGSKFVDIVLLGKKGIIIY